jgi:hypothetical protein
LKVPEGYFGDMSFTAHWVLPIRTLTHPITNISVSGRIHGEAELMTTDLTSGHGDDCQVCKAIEQLMNDDDCLFLKLWDISLSKEYSGKLTISIPVSPQCNGREITILHCANGTLKTYTATAVNGRVVFEAESLSPFAMFAEDYDLPAVITGAVTEVSDTGAKLSGSVTSDGGATVTERGFVYGTAPDPEIDGEGVTKITAGSGMGDFTANLEGLEPDTEYYVRAYAVNSKSTAYGGIVSFRTEEESMEEGNGGEDNRDDVSDENGEEEGVEEEEDKGSDGDTKTGDSGLPRVWWLLFTVAAAGITVLIVSKNEKKACKSY